MVDPVSFIVLDLLTPGTSRTSNLRHTTLVTLPSRRSFTLLQTLHLRRRALSETDASDHQQQCAARPPRPQSGSPRGSPCVLRPAVPLVARRRTPIRAELRLPYNQETRSWGLPDWRFLLSLGAHIVLLATAVWGFSGRHVIGWAADRLLCGPALARPESGPSPLGTVMGERPILRPLGRLPPRRLGWFVVWVGGYLPRGPGPIRTHGFAGRDLRRLDDRLRNRTGRTPGTLFASGLRTSPHSARCRTTTAPPRRRARRGASAWKLAGASGAPKLVGAPLLSQPALEIPPRV